MFKNPFSFDGRIRRLEYGLSYLIYIAALIAAGASSELLFGGGETDMGAFGPILFIVYIPMLYFLIAQGAKRCHDRNNSGWWQIIPFYGFWMLFADGDWGYNDYGPNPKTPEEFYDEFEEKEEIAPIDDVDGDGTIKQ